MKRFDENIEITTDIMNTIARYMDDEKREIVHHELMDCTNEEFIKKVY